MVIGTLSIHSALIIPYLHLLTGTGDTLVSPGHRPLDFLTFYFRFHQVTLGIKSLTIFDTKRKGSQRGSKHAKILPKKRSLRIPPEKGGTGVGRGLNSGPGEAAASSTRAEPRPAAHPAAQLPEAAAPARPRLPPRAPPPVRSSSGFPLAEPRAGPASCGRESRRCASASVVSPVGSGDGRVR